MANLSSIVIVLSMALGVAWLFRRPGHLKSQRYRTTYEISFPSGMTFDQVVRTARTVIGELPKPKRFHTYFPVLLEKHGVGDSKRHYISIPDHLDDNVRLGLNRVIPGIMLEALSPAEDPIRFTHWDRVIEFGHVGLEHLLDIRDPEDIASSIDAKFEALEQGEELLLQLAISPGTREVFTKETKDKLDEFTVHIAMRAAAKGDHAKRNLNNLLSSLRRVGTAHAQLTRAWWMLDIPGRIRRRAGRPYPIFLNVLELVPLMGWNLDGEGSRRARRLPLNKLVALVDDGIALAYSNWARTKGKPIYLSTATLSQHQWWIGPTGSGKSTMLHNQAFQFAAKGMGFCVIDPKGDLVRDILGSMPGSRVEDVIFFDPSDVANPIGFNILAGTDPHRTTQHVLALFKAKYGANWGPQLEMTLRTALYTAAEHKLSLFEVIELLRNPDFRRSYVRTLKDSSVRRDWQDIDAKPDSVYSSINKVHSFVASPLMQNIVGQVNGGIQMADIIRGNKILLVALDSVAMGGPNAEILAEMLIDQLWMAKRAVPEKERSPYPLIVDEFQRFVQSAESIEEMLALARSYQLPITAVHQFLDQLSTDTLHALHNNARTKGVFGLSPDNARKMAPYFQPLTQEDLETLQLHEVAMSIMTPEGIAPTVTGLTYEAPRPTGFGPKALEASRAQYSRPGHEVAAEIENRYKTTTETRKRPPVARVIEED